MGDGFGVGFGVMTLLCAEKEGMVMLERDSFARVCRPEKTLPASEGAVDEDDGGGQRGSVDDMALPLPEEAISTAPGATPLDDCDMVVWESHALAVLGHWLQARATGFDYEWECVCLSGCSFSPGDGLIENGRQSLPTKTWQGAVRRSAERRRGT